MQIHIGCSGWFYWHWRGIFYPDTKRTDSWFKHYTSTFKTVELNAPFYSWPKRSRWYRHDYTPEELSAWARKIEESGAREAWIYFDNDREGFAIKNAQALIAECRAMRLDVL